jgi:hypothetical protein
MKVYFGQVYIKPGVRFAFSHHFQRRLSEVITALVVPSAKITEEFGGNFNLIFNISAKNTIQDNEIRGPTVFKKTRDVEYTLFLPFDVISCSSDVSRSALTFLLKGTCSVFKSLAIDTAAIVEAEESMIENICSDPMMFEQNNG